jgi:hypothetical protein
MPGNIDQPSWCHGSEGPNFCKWRPIIPRTGFAPGSIYGSTLAGSIGFLKLSWRSKGCSASV